MSNEIHPLSRREGPVPPVERERRTVPFDASLPDVCVHRKTCFALYVQSEGGMGWLLSKLAFYWAFYGIVWTGVIWWWVLPGLALMLAVTLPLLLASSVVYRRRGHRGWCWALHSLDLEEIIPDVLTPFALIELFFMWILWPFRRLWHLFAWIWRLLSGLGDL
ncbi:MULTISPECIES: hypothetical protein [Streptosporangium]|uniref:Transmembrane protein n=1 Tax=Streptosporangium brasiliense TaxID=47480 RepID=A0ABT9R7E1_9ACTN|nr:hypothetical protein [Streptosporangium brasiliense]MDP9864325.1 hypothetical protein [Streptosporangium brasiliense]